MSKPKAIPSLLKAKCPRCRKGLIFATFWQMNTHCPHCNTKFEREDGYFMMAVLFGYILYGIPLLPIAIAMYIADVPLVWYWSIVAAIIIFTPLVFRAARVVWIHLDQVLDPRRD